jgi:hypothetical protein
VSARFGRVENRRRFVTFLDGALAELRRKNCWTIAEHTGETSPDGMQHFLNQARWDTNGVTADLREFVIAHLGEPDTVLVIDLCRPRNYADGASDGATNAWPGWASGRGCRRGGRHSYTSSRNASSESLGR